MVVEATTRLTHPLTDPGGSVAIFIGTPGFAGLLRKKKSFEDT